jgi:large subunit ribosomal protein L44e
MKLKKLVKRYCPRCKKHTEQKLSLVSSGHSRGALTRGSIGRAEKRGLGGMGNVGRWGSKPAINKWKMKVKSTKKTNIMYTCSVCKKSKSQKEGTRTGKIQLE